MAGHSKWHSIKHKKMASDAKTGKIFTKHAKLITIAARDGGGDPAMNPSLRVAIANAKADNTPNKNIERAIKKGTGELSGANEIIEIYYEGFAQAGVALYIHCITDNKNRSHTNVRKIMSKNGGNLGEAGVTGWMFDRKGMLVLDMEGKDAEETQLLLIEGGAEDFEELEGEMLVYCEAGDTHNLAQVAEEAGYAVKKKELTFLPNQTVEITDKTVAEKILNLVSLVEDDDDVL
jgi:YebC/PmpR family DNA-binding regulatory protein